MFDGGAAPAALIELDIAQRMGWTLSELDEQDEARVIPGLVLQGKRDALQNVKRFLETQGQVKPSDDDLKTYDEVNAMLNDEVVRSMPEEAESNG